MTLVELMIAMLILTLVCTAWLEIIGIQSARKEARRREAVERLAGMMDAFMAMKKMPGEIQASGGYHFKGLVEDEYDRLLDYKFEFEHDDVATRHYLFNKEISPIRYSLSVEKESPLNNAVQSKNWKFGGRYCYWLVGRLYDNSELGQSPFFTLPVCLGFPL